MPDLDHDMYSMYLTEHYLGASSGVQAFKAAASAWEGSAVGDQLQQLTEEIEGDRETLGDLIRTLGYSVGPVKQAAAAGAQVAGRLNPLNLLRAHQDAGARIEIETLTGLVRAKRCLWETLLTLSAVDSRLDADQFRGLANLARSQEDRLDGMIQDGAVEAFTTD